MKIIQHSIPARAALAGNPSDGYGGQTLSLAIDNFHAQVRLIPWDHVEIVLREQDKNRFDSIDELVDDVTRHGYYDGIRLIKASIKRFVDYCRARQLALHDRAFSIGYSTDIPQGVGLSGSSAIVVATLRSLMDYYDLVIPHPVLASLARAVENDELGISCGYQDRVAQVYGGLTYMNFADMPLVDGYPCGRYQRIDVAKLPALYLAYDESAAKPSSRVHNPLRERMAQEPQLAQWMEEIANQAAVARDAILAGDWQRLNAAIDHNFDLRKQLYPLFAPHLRMIETARAAGVSANFAGSGGAIVGSYGVDPQGDAARFDRLRHVLESAESTWRVVRIIPAAAVPEPATRTTTN